MGRYAAVILCQHLQSPIEHIQSVFENLMELKICLISHHTLTLYIYHNLMYIGLQVIYIYIVYNIYHANIYTEFNSDDGIYAFLYSPIRLINLAVYM